MNAVLKDLIQVASWAAAIIAGLLAAFVAIRQLKLGTEQRQIELRWRQANAAKESINEIHCNSWAKNAVIMFDLSEGKHHRLTFVEEKHRFEISYEKNVIPALEKSYRECSDIDQDIAYCFDWFFYFIDRIEHYIRTDLIKFEDVKDVFRPYSEKVKEHEQVFEPFMNKHSYKLANAFWKRYRA